MPTQDTDKAREKSRHPGQARDILKKCKSSNIQLVRFL